MYEYLSTNDYEYENEYLFTTYWEMIDNFILKGGL
jgi:hypothetical protein